jgi:hypothetical protein
LRIIIVKKELFGIPRRKRLELCGLKRKWLAISSQIPYNSTKLPKEKFSNSQILDYSKGGKLKFLIICQNHAKPETH